MSALIIKIESLSDIPLVDLTISLLNLGAQYNRFLERKDIYVEEVKNPLVIKKLETGSVIIELVAAVIPALQQINTVYEFTIYIKDTLEFFLGKIDKPPITYDKKDLEQINNIVNLTANTPNSQINFVSNNNSEQVVNLTINYTDSNAIQNRVKYESERLKELPITIYKKQLLKWYQTRFDGKSDKGDKAIIENIYHAPIKVIFETINIKNNIINTKGFTRPWHELAYIVDVEVLLLDKRPKVYKILDFYPEETFDSEE
jgi:hypothetical protein